MRVYKLTDFADQLWNIKGSFGEFVKFDFNADLYYDKYGTGFAKYFKGYCDYIKNKRKIS